MDEKDRLHLLKIREEKSKNKVNGEIIYREQIESAFFSWDGVQLIFYTATRENANIAPHKIKRSWSVDAGEVIVTSMYDIHALEDGTQEDDTQPVRDSKKISGKILYKRFITPEVGLAMEEFDGTISYIAKSDINYIVIAANIPYDRLIQEETAKYTAGLINEQSRKSYTEFSNTLSSLNSYIRNLITTISRN